MAYITNSDIEDRLGSLTYVQLTDDDEDGNADEVVVNEARLGACREADSYLATRHQVPIDLDAYPELAALLKSVVLDLVEYRLRGRRPPISEATKRKRDETVEWLARVSAGVIDLPAMGSVVASAARGIRATALGEERLLTRDEMSDH